jgi:hypothetical protein
VDRVALERILRDRVELERRALEQRASALDTLAVDVARSRMLSQTWRPLLTAAHELRRIAKELP